ncbi:MAG: succinylglutamate desuccinylase/aspartoacylase family protein [Planctomycetes bacterium]|nr:succinylglutamate desuccinylase/aspartoacylase family protein [Planctomycetota bacterium]
MNSLTARVLLVVGLVVTASAQGPTQPFDPSDWGDVLVHNVTRADVIRLTLAGIDVQSVQGTTALLYLSTKQTAALRAQGYSLLELPRAGAGGKQAGYHTYVDLTNELQAVAAAHPAICQLVSIGTSVQGRELWFMKISDNVGVEEDEPEFRYGSSIHGDEVVGIELCMNLIDLLTSSYGTDPQITALVDSVEIWIMPMMNPDGTTASSRYNAQGRDLNRSFPDRVNDPVNTTSGRPLEVQRVMNWAFAHSPVLSANFHGGSRVVNYPYDSDPNRWASYSACPDDDLFIEQSLTYSRLNTPMYNSSSFPRGITNGVAWYLIYGGMQDWSYVWQGCNDVTIELYGTKWPPYAQIAGLWNDNRAAMLAYMELCLKGVRGLMTDLATGLPLAGTVQVVGRTHDVFTDPDVGDYHRMLLPGTYSIVYSASGYVSQTFHGVSVGPRDATRVDVALAPVGFRAPVPDVRVNGQNGPLTIPSATPVSVTVSLTPNDLVGVPQDWWFSVTYGATTIWWTWPAVWSLSRSPCYDGPLFQLSGLEIVSGNLPPGIWTFAFGVDRRDGIFQGTLSDSITVTAY